jgi:hypothetical protein
MSILETLKLLNEDFFLLNDAESIEMHIKALSVDTESVQNRSLLYPPATKDSIKLKQKLLGVKLPPSYISFLLVSNGFRNISPFLDNIFSIEKIDWARNLEEQWSIDMFNDDPVEVSNEQYFYYGEDQDPILSRTKYITESLKISEWYDGMCLFLNPIIRFGDEWEVLEYATWYPGIRRYKSFRDYLLNTHASNQRLFNGRIKNNIS